MKDAPAGSARVQPGLFRNSQGFRATLGRPAEKRPARPIEGSPHLSLVRGATIGSWFGGSQSSGRCATPLVGRTPARLCGHTDRPSRADRARHLHRIRARRARAGGVVFASTQRCAVRSPDDPRSNSAAHHPPRHESRVPAGSHVLLRRLQRHLLVSFSSCRGTIFGLSFTRHPPSRRRVPIARARPSRARPSAHVRRRQVESRRDGTREPRG
jgi:hypothetical protein